MLTPTETGIAAESINYAYERAIESAANAREMGSMAVQQAVACGKFMAEQHAVVGRSAWGQWLAANCPKISYEIARRWMICAKTYHGRIPDDCASLRQLYVECGILPRPEVKEGEPQPERTIFEPLRKTLDFYTAERLGKLNDITGPGMLRLVDEGLSKLSKIKTELTAKFGAQKYG